MFTQNDIATLKAAVASGILTVSYNGPPARTITYQSLDAMRSLLANMQADVNAQSGAKPYRLAGGGKGI